MMSLRKVLLIGAWMVIQLPAACNKETEFGSAGGIGDKITEPLPADDNIAGVEVPTPKPGGGCVDKEGKDQGVVLSGFPESIENCVRGSVAERGIFNFGAGRCEKMKFNKIACSKESIRTEIVKGGMSPNEFDSYAGANDVVFYEGGCGQFTNAKGEKIVMVQFYVPPKGQFDDNKCVYKVNEDGRFVTGCYINAKDNSWASLSAKDKVQRCFREAPR